jgi:hypothetical protein
MTSFRQIEANRRNAHRSTGPKTEEGKRQSRRNALRHGLTAETVIDGLEDSEDYRAFEAAVIADYDAQTAVERELVLRLASLLWRCGGSFQSRPICLGSNPTSHGCIAPCTSLWENPVRARDRHLWCSMRSRRKARTAKPRRRIAAPCTSRLET